MRRKKSFHHREIEREREVAPISILLLRGLIKIPIPLSGDTRFRHWPSTGIGSVAAWAGQACSPGASPCLRGSRPSHVPGPRNHKTISRVDLLKSETGYDGENLLREKLLRLVGLWRRIQSRSGFYTRGSPARRG